MSGDKGPERWNRHDTCLVAVSAASFLMLAYTAAVAYALGFYILMVLMFILGAMALPNSSLFHRFRRARFRDKVILIFLLALVLRGMMLLSEEVITVDMELYVERSEHILDGNIPYRDFDVNKPPLYLYLGQAVGGLFGTGLTEFRAFFSVLDAIVAVSIFLLGLKVVDERTGAFAGLAYALSPMGIVMIGFSGHYDPIVILLVIMGIYLHFSDKWMLAALLLGTAFAFKFYSLFLIPFFLWHMRPSKRIPYVLLFILPMVLSFIPIMAVYPDAPDDYFFGYQGGKWALEAKKSISFGLIHLSGGHEYLLGLSITKWVFGFFGLVMGLFYTSWAAITAPAHGKWSKGDGRTKGMDRFWKGIEGLVVWIGTTFGRLFRIPGPDAKRDPRSIKASFYQWWSRTVVLTYFLYFGIVAAGSIIFFEEELGLDDPVPSTVAFIVIYFGMLSCLWPKFQRRIVITHLSPSDDMFLFFSFSLMLLMFGSPDYCPWYILWFLPFVLLLRHRIKWLLLFLMPWNFPGKGLNLLPEGGLRP